MDVVDVAKRSEMMAGIRSKNTLPEMVVRKYLHSKGFRYRLHNRKLPGSPDLALTSYKVAVFVHGCFWHRHAGCKYATTPRSNVDRWDAKFTANVARDRRNIVSLERLGWSVVVVWECELRINAPSRLERLVEQIRAAAATCQQD